MIRSWGTSTTRRFYEDGKAAKFRGMDIDAAQELLAILDSMTSLADLGALNSAGLHKLRGGRAGQWAISISGRWRICFRFRAGDAHDVEITDYHRG